MADDADPDADPVLDVEVADVRGYPDTIAADLDVDGDRVTVTARDAGAARWLYEWLEKSVEYYRGEFVAAKGEHDAARRLSAAVYEEFRE